MLNLLITGSNSFLGKRFIQKIDRNVYSVYGIDINAQNEKKNNYKFKKIDLNKKTFKIFHGNFDIIVHLAAISNDNDCKSNISNCYKTNIKGTINLLNNINLDRLNKFIFAVPPESLSMLIVLPFKFKVALPDNSVVPF